jgi:23S rRNA (uracil1939-C5)-methyltransferase
VDIETCVVLAPELDAQLRRLRGEIPWETFWDETSRIDAAAGDNGEISIYSSDLTEPTKEISSAVADERFAYSAQAFFQGNRYMVDKLVDAALKDAKGGTALDLYSGVGLFALPLARSFENVTAVEENELAVEFARKNARAAGLENIEFIADPVKRFLRMGNRDRADLILLDPPRSGAEPETIKRIAERRPNVISYVSCEPSMLARDLRVFLDNGYSIKFVTVLDMFPQTHHVETVVRLSV